MNEEFADDGVNSEELNDQSVENDQIAEPQTDEVPKSDPPEKIASNLKAALREEREKRKVEQARARQLEDTFARFVEMSKNQVPPTQTPKEDPIPDPTVDLGGHLFAKQQQLEKQLAEQRAQVQREEVERNEYLKQQSTLQAYRVHAQNFAKNTPDFSSAYNALVADRVEELQVMGFLPEQAAQMAYNEEMMIVNQALQGGANPAERIYQIAKRRGLVKAQAAPQNAAQTVLDAASKADSMAGASGDTPKGKMTLEQLAKLDGDDFLKAWDKVMR